MAEYLFAVQDDNGREVCAAYVETDKVSEVVAVRNGNTGQVVILHNKETVAEGAFEGRGKLTLHRWPADDKLGESVRHKVEVMK